MDPRRGRWRTSLWKGHSRAQTRHWLGEQIKEGDAPGGPRPRISGQGFGGDPAQPQDLDRHRGKYVLKCIQGEAARACAALALGRHRHTSPPLTGTPSTPKECLQNITRHKVTI